MSQAVVVPTKTGTVIVNETGEPCLIRIDSAGNAPWVTLSDKIGYVTNAQVSRLMETGFRVMSKEDMKSDD